MNKEELLFDQFLSLIQYTYVNGNALQSVLDQLFDSNPKLGLNCWEESIYSRYHEIAQDFGKENFDFNSMGYMLIGKCEYYFCRKECFVSVLDEYARKKELLDIIYTKSPIHEPLGIDFGAVFAISYLIRKDRLQEADNILSAIYKNKTYTNYSNLWKNIIDKFQLGDLYNPRVYKWFPLVQPKHIRNFCLEWIDKINDEEEQAGAMTFAMQMFE